MKSARFSLGLVALCLFAHTSAFAAWPTASDSGVPVAADSLQDESEPSVVTDGAGGALVLWTDTRFGPAATFVSHLRFDGVLDAAWPASGRMVGASGQETVAPVLTSDGEGGAFVAWTDARNGSLDVYAQHLLADGTLDSRWPAGGLAVCAAAFTQAKTVITGDGSGGAFIAWEDSRLNSSSIVNVFVQHVRADGTVDPAWPALGRAASLASRLQSNIVLLADGSGGVLAAWIEFRPGIFGEIYAQRLTASGAIAAGWPANGAAILSGSAADRSDLQVVSDGADGAFLTWNELATFFDPYRVRALRFDGSGHVPAPWPAAGVDVASPGVNAFQGKPVADGQGGLLLAWHELFPEGLYATRIQPFGVIDPAWPAPAPNLMSAPRANAQIGNAVSDGSGGLVLTWSAELETDPYSDIFAAHVRSDGVTDPLWQPGGVLVCDATDAQFAPRAVSDGSGGAVIAWRDLRRVTLADIYAQHVDWLGRRGDVGSTAVPVWNAVDAAFAPAAPSPAAIATTLRFSLPAPSHVRLAVFDANGRRVRTLLDGEFAAGAHASTWDLQNERGGRVAPGLYFARFTALGRDVTRRVIVLD